MQDTQLYAATFNLSPVAVRNRLLHKVAVCSKRTQKVVGNFGVRVNYTIGDHWDYTLSIIELQIRMGAQLVYQVCSTENWLKGIVLII